ncbi:MAG: UDP-2,4-diacetamido-2,4,6-trideoxy-beta-L-altropyranose hydrolase [Nitrospirae bacterium]|nr:UDP-2,4-diacetamido-2,4,6-trideoxy-beta-L-altropyranose hydrolase [Candidatus Manganitrophaceae bacterium]
MINVLILTEGGRDVGFGHITRCTALYQAFEERGISTEFIVEGDESVEGLLQGRQYRIMPWRSDLQKLTSLLESAEIIVIDSYLAGIEIYEIISKRAKYPVYIDDYQRIAYPKGLLVNGTLYAEEMDYPQGSERSYLLGSRYILLHKEFWNIRHEEAKETVGRILITFGGDDVRGLTPKIMKLLIDAFPDCKKRVIIGKGFREVNEIERLKDIHTELDYYPDREGMKRAILESDVAVSAGGQTLYELARVGVPAVSIAVAENQLNNVMGWERAGFIDYAGWWESRMLLERVLASLIRLRDKGERVRRSQIGKKLVDGGGSGRVRDFLLGL